MTKAYTTPNFQRRTPNSPAPLFDPAFWELGVGSWELGVGSCNTIVFSRESIDETRAPHSCGSPGLDPHGLGTCVRARWSGYGSAPTGSVSSLPNGVERITSVEGITEYRLANGLQVLLFPDPSKPTITVNVTYLVGSRHEGYGETGMAHLLEHMLFKGSPRHPEHPEELTEHGARPNGTTWFDRTNYFETFPATDENLEWALDLEADRMVNSFIAKADLDSEMTVVRNEFEIGREQPDQRPARSACSRRRTSGTTTASRPSAPAPISRTCRSSGCRRSIASTTSPTTRCWSSRASSTSRRRSSSINAVLRRDSRSPTRTLPTLYTAEPTQDGERTVTLRRVGDVQWVAVGVPHAGRRAPRLRAARLLVVPILGDRQPAGCTRRWSKRSKASQRLRRQLPASRPGHCIFCGAGPSGLSRSTTARDSLIEHRRGDRKHATNNRGNRACAHRVC